MLRNDQADREINLFATFRRHCAKFSTKNELELPKQKAANLEAISDIDEEIGSLKEIKDIRDELRMILRILKDQAMVLSMMTGVIEGNLQDVETRLRIPPSLYETSNLLRNLAAQPMQGQKRTGSVKMNHQMNHLEIDANIRGFQKMLDDADAVQDSV